MSAHCPNRCTGTIALVREVTAASTASAQMLKVSGSMSTKTGVAPARWIELPVAKNEYGLVITSSPGPTSSARSARMSASVPDPQPIACRVSTNASNSFSKSATCAPITKCWDWKTSSTTCRTSSRIASYCSTRSIIGTGVGIGSLLLRGRIASDMQRLHSLGWISRRPVRTAGPQKLDGGGSGKGAVRYARSRSLSRGGIYGRNGRTLDSGSGIVAGGLPERCRSFRCAGRCLRCVRKPLIDDRRVRRQRDAIEIDDLTVNHQFEIGRPHPGGPGGILPTNWSLGMRLLVLPARGRVDHHTRGLDLHEIGLGCPHQDNGSPIAFDLQQMRPGSLELFPIGEGDQVVLVGEHWTHIGLGLFSQQFQSFRPAFWPRSSVSN